MYSIKCIYKYMLGFLHACIHTVLTQLYAHVSRYYCIQLDEIMNHYSIVYHAAIYTYKLSAL